MMEFDEVQFPESKAWTVSVEPPDGNLQAPIFPTEPANFTVEAPDERKKPPEQRFENQCFVSATSVLVQC